MEDKIEKDNNISDKVNVIQEDEEYYKKCLIFTQQDLKQVKTPYLKYAIYNLNLLEAFETKKNKIKDSIKELTEKLSDYKGNKIDPIIEKKALEEINNKSDGKDVKEGYFYYNDYLIKSAKKYNTLGDETT